MTVRAPHEDPVSTIARRPRLLAPFARGALFTRGCATIRSSDAAPFASRQSCAGELPISKILTLNKVHILEKLCAIHHTAEVPPADYFQVGRAVTDPPRIRGSMILKLNQRFLRDNAAFFECGSPIDRGAIRCGFLQPADVESFLAGLVCDYARFSKLLFDLEGLPPEVVGRVAQHRNAPETAEVLARHFAPEIVQFMLDADEPAAWSFEFSVRAGYGLSPDHVEALLAPNTYADVPIFREVHRRIGSRFITFNPRFGLENL